MRVSVKERMTGNPVSIAPDASALEALELMVRHGIHHLPVVDGAGQLVGVLSQSDLRAALPMDPGADAPLPPRAREVAREWKVGEMMSYAPETIGVDSALAEAADRMADRRIGCLPVVEGQKLVGILSETDVLRTLATAAWAEGLPEERRAARELEDIVEQLREERSRIASRLDGYHATERELSSVQHDEPLDAPERAADLREVGLVEHIDELTARRLEAIDRALDHAAQGGLGVCDACGGSIPVPRLRALPGTTVCVDCARESEGRAEPETPFERVPGGRAETGRPELGALVYTRFGEGRLLRVVPYGSCTGCGDVEGRYDAESDRIRCSGCGLPIDATRERAVVGLGEREVYVGPEELSRIDPTPYD
jgi:CBS domain-containing protein/RNA polymerase-binding transcription factor DksA